MLLLRPLDLPSLSKLPNYNRTPYKTSNNNNNKSVKKRLNSDKWKLHKKSTEWFVTSACDCSPGCVPPWCGCCRCSACPPRWGVWGHPASSWLLTSTSSAPWLLPQRSAAVLLSFPSCERHTSRFLACSVCASKTRSCSPVAFVLWEING